MEVLYTSRFKHEAKKVPRNLHKITEEQVDLFKNDPFHPHLKTHKLSGRLKEFWSFSIDYRYRIIFEFTKSNQALFHSIGDHSIYD